jgi:hypothetical protein
MTYNFATDPRLKRGRNFGVVYVTSRPSEEKQDLQSTKKSELHTKIKESEV